MGGQTRTNAAIQGQNIPGVPLAFKFESSSAGAISEANAEICLSISEISFLADQDLLPKRAAHCKMPPPM